MPSPFGERMLGVAVTAVIVRMRTGICATAGVPLVGVTVKRNEYVLPARADVFQLASVPPTTGVVLVAICVHDAGASPVPYSTRYDAKLGPLAVPVTMTTPLTKAFGAGDVIAEYGSVLVRTTLP